MRSNNAFERTRRGQGATIIAEQHEYTQWAAPTMAIYDLDRNEIYFWLSDTERVKWQTAHAGAA